jgi:uncharacterized Zn finger protein
MISDDILNALTQEQLFALLEICIENLSATPEGEPYLDLIFEKINETIEKLEMARGET